MMATATSQNMNIIAQKRAKNSRAACAARAARAGHAL